ncbi:alcohol dehydrogenase [Cordyceps militaris]|uniref:Alcohol dehydrogenase n=1 Tax=Cordyceps militaris TaxID=73501 RepID=A0A2H4SR77_CORMI|nr:alcohol dehydrogenase [Cordyceps militaris]
MTPNDAQGAGPAGKTSDGPHIPKFCKAGVMTKEGPDFKVEVLTVPTPEPGPTELLIRLNCTGICRSDIGFMRTDFGHKLSSFGVQSPGHEGAGVVVKVGELVKDWKVGDRAGIKPMWSTCQNCQLCWTDKEAYCPTRLNSGMRVTGSYQQYITSPAHYTQPIPDGVPDHVAGPLMCSASTIYRSIRESKLQHGQWALFPGGGGGVGLQGVQICAALGLRPIVIDTGADKRAICMEFGAEAFIDFKEVEDVAAEVVAIADGIGAHGVFVTAPSAYSYAVACIGTRVGGCILAVGLPPFDSPMIVGATPRQFIYQNLMIKGTLTASRRDFADVLDLAKRGKLKSITTEVFPIDRLPEAVEKVARAEVVGRCVVDFNS